MAEEREERKGIKIVIDEFTGGSFRYEDGEIKGIRIFPACKYADCGSRRLSPVELNEAVQMWMNRTPTNGPVWDNLNTALAEKDAEIARLNNIWNAHHSKCDERFSILSREHDNTVVLVKKLKDRIAELEKLSTMQKATIDAQGKARDEALSKISDLLCAEFHAYQSPLPFSAQELVRKQGDIIRSLRVEYRQSQEKEPELFICPDQGPGCICSHNKPHLKQSDCNGFDDCGGKCIPYKEPAQTSAPEEGRSPIQHLQDRVLELEQHQGRDRADLMEKIRVLESQAHAAYCCNDDAAKGVGVLTSRVDKMEKDAEILKDSFVTPHGIDIANIFTRVSRLETALETLKDKTRRELSQAFAEVNRVLAEHRKVGDASRDRIDILDSDLAAVMRAALKQKDQIKGLEHRLGLAQDRIAEIHPSGCVPPAKSKPKSRLKTDRMKKVTK